MSLRPRGLPPPPSRISRPIAHYLAEVQRAFNGLPFSYSSTTDGFNTSAVTAPVGTLGIEIGDGDAAHWRKIASSNTEGWERIPREHWFNVLDFGAEGDGTADDTSALQDAIDAAEAAGGGIVFVPANTYLVNPLTIDSGDVEIVGAGIAGSRLKLADGQNTDLLTVSAARVGLRNLRLSANAANQTAGAALDIGTSAHWFSAKNCRFDDGADECVDAAGANQILFEHCLLFSSPDGFVGTNNVNCNFVGCTFEDNTSEAVRLSGGASAQHYGFYGCYFEDNDFAINYTGAGARNQLIVIGCRIFGGTNRTDPEGIRVAGSAIQGWIVNGCRFHNLDNAFVNLGAATASGYNDFRLNQYTGTTPTPNAFAGFDLGLEAGRGLQAFTDGDSTPSVDGWMRFKTANGSATTITNLDDGVEGQEVELFVEDSNTSFKHGTNIFLESGADETAEDGDTYQFVQNSNGSWMEF